MRWRDRLLAGGILLALVGCSDADPEPVESRRVRHLLDEWDQVIGYDGVWNDLMLPEVTSDRTQLADDLPDGTALAPVPWRPAAGQVHVVRGGERLDARTTPAEVREAGGFVFLPAEQRVTAADLTEHTGTELPERPNEPRCVRLPGGGELWWEGLILSSRTTLSFRARAEAAPSADPATPCGARVEVDGELRGSFLLPPRWEDFELDLALSPGVHRIRWFVERPESTRAPSPHARLQWLALVDPGRDRVLVRNDGPRAFELQYLPETPAESEELPWLTSDQDSATLRVLSLGGPVTLRVPLGCEELEVAGQRVPGNELQVELAAGFHRVRARSPRGPLLLLQPAARLVPMLGHPDLRLRDDGGADPRGRGPIPAAVADVILTRAESHFDRRAGFCLPPPSALLLRLALHAGDRLRYGAGVARVENLESFRDARTELRIEWQPLRGAARILDRCVLSGAHAGFEDREVVVPEGAGGEGILRLVTQTLEGPAFLPACIADPRLIPAESVAAERPPNVLLYLIDTLRADHVGAYGHSRDTTPTLDRLASEGYLFENFQAVASWTRPTTASILTGLYPEFHGVHDAQATLAFSNRTLAEVLRTQGYSTWAAVTNSQVSAFGLHFEQGFHRFVTPRAMDIAAASDVPDETSRKATDVLLPWLDHCSEEPFFLFLHTLDPHLPYLPPARWRGRFTGPYRGPLKDELLDINALWGLVAKDPATGEAELLATEQDMEYIRGIYDEEIRAQDEQIERLLQHLQEAGELDRTLLVFLSDHGEEFQEHHRWNHRGRMWDVHLRVPLILWVPPVLRGGLAPAGTRIPERVSQVDLLPTLLELLHIEDPAPRQGRSLVPLLRGLPLAERPVYASEGVTLGAIMDGDYKLIWTPGTTDPPLQLYATSEDPGEQRDLAPLRTEQVQRMQLLRDAFLEDFQRQGFRAPSTGEEIQYDSWEAEQLRALGYVDEDDG